jgi:hypothetical protein
MLAAVESAPTIGERLKTKKPANTEQVKDVPQPSQIKEKSEKTKILKSEKDVKKKNDVSREKCELFGYK